MATSPIYIRVASVRFDGHTWSITYYPWQADQALAQINYWAKDPGSHISVYACAKLAYQVIWETDRAHH